MNEDTERLFGAMFTTQGAIVDDGAIGIVRATCPTCGTVDIRAGHVTILPRIAVLENVYRFCCPLCASWIVRDASPSTVMLLLRAGANPAPWDVRFVDSSS